MRQVSSAALAAESPSGYHRLVRNPSYGDGDPIAAIATALSESALSVVRTSGPLAVELASRVFSRPEALLAAPNASVVHGWILGPGGARIDEVLLSVFRAPSGFTGEDSVDATCHGGVASTRAVLAAFEAAGFRQALPGEFAFRAFMNGKIDLTRAESVMELVAAKTDRARERAVGRLSGDLFREIASIKDDLVGVLAEAELYLDYSEDDGVGAGADAGGDEAAGVLPGRASAEACLARLDALAASYRVERLYGAGATVAVAGRPNAGKSSLFNRLLREERSIVSATPGTTRDWIEAWIDVAGVPVRLVDTAGLRDAEDPVEKEGVARSRGVVEEADLVLYVVDGTAGLDDEDRAFLRTGRAAPVLAVWNKADAASSPAPEGFLPASARTGSGVADLIERAVALLEGRADGRPAEASGVGIASARQKELVDRARASLRSALDLDSSRMPLDLAAPALRDAVDALGEITGEVSTEDVLSAMFGRFCVGK